MTSVVERRDTSNCGSHVGPCHGLTKVCALKTSPEDYLMSISWHWIYKNHKMVMGGAKKTTNSSDRSLLDQNGQIGITN